MTLSDHQEKVLSILSLVFSLFSICGSAMIIARILRCRSYTTPYNRLMIGLSVSDIVTSFVLGFGVFLLPEETSTRVWARGNETTCHMLGFFSQLTMLAVVYNGLLSLYYLLTVRYGVHRDVFARKYEPWFHMLPILFFVGTATAGLAFGMYSENEITQLCWIGEYPENCKEEGHCVGHYIGIGFAGVWLVLVFFGLPISNLIIYLHVRKTMKKTQTKNCEVEVSSDWDEIQNDRVREVAQQGFLYVIFFYVAYSPALAVRALDGFTMNQEDEASIYWLLILYSILLPLQGWFNLFIYMRPNYTRVRKAFPESSIWWVMKASWWELRLPTLEQSHSIVRSTIRQSKPSGYRPHLVASQASAASKISQSNKAPVLGIKKHTIPFGEYTSEENREGVSTVKEKDKSLAVVKEPHEDERQATTFGHALDDLQGEERPGKTLATNPSKSHVDTGWGVDTLLQILEIGDSNGEIMDGDDDA